MNDSRHYRRLALALTTAVLVVAGCSNQQSTPTSSGPIAGDDTVSENAFGTIPFSDTQIYFEYNATANDAGIQVFLDAEDWKRVEIVDDQGRSLLDITTGGGMRELGLTELRFEGAEPGGLEALDAFPAGEYEFRGVTVERQRLVGAATLSHDLPAASSFTPSNGETVDPDNVVISWSAVAGVDRYQVIVENDASGMSMEVTVSSSVSSLHVPPTFLVPNTPYKAEVLAIAPSGNRTITEGTFNTGP